MLACIVHNIRNVLGYYASIVRLAQRLKGEWLMCPLLPFYFFVVYIPYLHLIAVAFGSEDSELHSQKHGGGGEGALDIYAALLNTT